LTVAIGQAGAREAQDVDGERAFLAVIAAQTRPPLPMTPMARAMQKRLAELG